MSGTTELSGPRWADAAAVLFALVFPTISAWLYFAALTGQAAWLQQGAWLVGKIVQFGFPLFWVLAVQRCRLRWTPPTRAGMAASLAFGTLVFALMLLVYHTWLGPAGYLAAGAKEVSQKVVGFGVTGLPSYVALGLFYSVAHSFLEEYYWRWFAFGQLRRLIPWKMAVLVSSLAFMGHHVVILSTYFGWFSWGTILFSLGVAIGGAVWAWIYHRSGSLYGPWLSHVLIDAAIFAIGYQMMGF